MTLKVFQNSYSVECWWTATSEGRLSYHMFINEPDLLWVPSFIALGIYFLFGTKFSRNEGIDICFNVEYVLLGRNFDFLGGYRSLPSGYYWLQLVTWWLLFVIARYCSFPLLVWTKISMCSTGHQHVKRRFCCTVITCYWRLFPLDTGRKLNAPKTFRRRPVRLLNVLCTFSLPPVSMGVSAFS